jgi:hypothetical protein
MDYLVHPSSLSSSLLLIFFFLINNNNNIIKSILKKNNIVSFSRNELKIVFRRKKMSKHEQCPPFECLER